jgi:hypothetical protein
MQQTVAATRRGRLVQTIEPRGQRRRPVVPPETLLRPAYATACTARRASLTSKQADENRHYDRTRTRAFRARHAPRPLEQQTVHVAPPECRHDQRMRTLRQSICRQRTGHHASRPAHHANCTGDRVRTHSPSAAVHRRSFNSIEGSSLAARASGSLCETLVAKIERSVQHVEPRRG